jgi:heptosyltransferase I
LRCVKSEGRCKIVFMKIAIVKLSALGDIVNAMFILQFIKKYNEDIQIDWIVEESYRGLLESNPCVDRVEVVDLKHLKKSKSIYQIFKAFKRVRDYGPYDIVIDMQGLIKSAFISRIIPSKYTIGFDKYSIRESLASIFYNKKFNFAYDRNVVERNFEIIKFAVKFNFKLTDINNKQPFLYSRKKHLNSSLSIHKKNIILVPGASHPSKIFPFNKLAELTQMIDANYLVIWGNDDERIIANKIKTLSPEVNVCEKLSIQSLISLVSQSDLLIGPDTGPTHFAWALNIPSITLFGPTPGYRNIFSTNINKYIESETKINPFKINKNDYSIKNINLEDIIKMAENLLKI